MTLRTMANTDLHQNMMLFPERERVLLAEVVCYIQEIDRRRLYFEYNCPSLFEYLTKICGYTNGAAQRRIDAARLANNVPLVSEKIKTGEMTLEKVTLVQKALRQLKKEDRPITKQQTEDLITGLLSLGEIEAQVKVASTLDLKIEAASKVNHQADRSVRVELTFTAEQWAMITDAKNILSHQVPDGNLPDVFEKMCELVIKTKRGLKKPVSLVPPEISAETTPEFYKSGVAEKLIATENKAINHVPAGPAVDPTSKHKKIATAMPAVNSLPPKIVANAAVSKAPPKSVTPKTRKIVFNNSNGCNFIYPLTKQKCGSHWQLQTDHRTSKWAGGTNEISNLQALCRKHNNYKYRKETGVKNI